MQNKSLAKLLFLIILTGSAHAQDSAVEMAGSMDPTTILRDARPPGVSLELGTQDGSIDPLENEAMGPYYSSDDPYLNPQSNFFANGFGDFNTLFYQHNNFVNIVNYLEQNPIATNRCPLDSYAFIESNDRELICSRIQRANLLARTNPGTDSFTGQQSGLRDLDSELVDKARIKNLNTCRIVHEDQPVPHLTIEIQRAATAPFERIYPIGELSNREYKLPQHNANLALRLRTNGFANRDNCGYLQGEAASCQRYITPNNGEVGASLDAMILGRAYSTEASRSHNARAYTVQEINDLYSDFQNMNICPPIDLELSINSYQAKCKISQDGQKFVLEEGVVGVERSSFTALTRREFRTLQAAQLAVCEEGFQARCAIELQLPAESPERPWNVIYGQNLMQYCQDIIRSRSSTGGRSGSSGITR